MTATLNQSTGPAHTRIYAYGAARGELVVPNDDLVGPIDSSDEWIRQRTGIITRTRAGKGTDAIDLADDAAREAIENSGIAADQIDAGDRRDDQQPAADPVDVGDRRRPRRREPGGRLRHQRGLRRLHLRRRPGRRAHPRGRRALRARRSAPRSSRDVVDPDRPHHLVPARRRRRRRRHRPERHARHRPDRVGLRRLEGRRRRHERHPRPSSATAKSPWPTLRQEGQTVFRWAVWEMAKVARAGARGRRHRGIRPRRVHPAPGEHAHHRRVRQAAEAARHRA